MNHQHINDNLYSLLSKSIQQGNEIYALYAASQFTYPITLKKYLLTITCENYPNLHMLLSISSTSQKLELYKQVIKLCRLPKSRIVVNAFRVVSFESYKPNKTVSIDDFKFNNPINDSLIMLPTIDTTNSSSINVNNNEKEIDQLINDIVIDDDNNNTNITNNITTNNKHQTSINKLESVMSSLTTEPSDDSSDDETDDSQTITNSIRDYTFNSPTNPININNHPLKQCKTDDSQTIYNLISTNEEKLLVKNAHTLFLLLCQNGVKTTINQLIYKLQLINKKYANGLKTIYKLINKQYIHICLVFLAISSLKVFISVDCNFILQSNPIPADYFNNIPNELTIPEFVFDITSSTPTNTDYKYYFDNLYLQPTFNRTLIDKFGEEKFIQIASPLELSIAEYIPTTEIQNIKLARIQQNNTKYIFALCSFVLLVFLVG